jgi:hypothetical protein
MPADRPWSHQVISILLPGSERAVALLLLAATFAVGVCVGMLLTATHEVDRHARETQRLAETLQHHRTEAEATLRRSDQGPLREALHERLDAIDQRLQALEHRLTP